MLSVLLVMVPSIIPDYGPDQFAISPGAALVEFYEEAAGPTQQLAELKALGYAVERVRVVNNESRLAVHYGIEKLPTFLAIFDRKEVARAEGDQTDRRLKELYGLARERETLSRAVLEGQLVYLGESTLSPGEEAEKLLGWLGEVGCNIRRANFDNPAHAPWFERYKVKERPLFLLLGREGKEVARHQGVSALPLLRKMRDIFAHRSIPQTGPRVLDFWASWCVECRRMDPVLAELKEAGHDVRKIDVDVDVFTADKFEIDELPAFVVLNKDGTESGRITGKTSKGALLQLLENAN